MAGHEDSSGCINYEGEGAGEEQKRLGKREAGGPRYVGGGILKPELSKSDGLSSGQLLKPLLPLLSCSLPQKSIPASEQCRYGTLTAPWEAEASFLSLCLRTKARKCISMSCCADSGRIWQRSSFSHRCSGVGRWAPTRQKHVPATRRLLFQNKETFPPLASDSCFL